MSELSTALQLAARAHDGQKDRVGMDYVWHPISVAQYCKTERAKIAALLHDVVEDTDTTLEDLRDAGIGEDVIAAVDCLTKRQDEAVEDYLRRVASDDIAVEVKFADMRHNGDKSRFPADRKEEAEANARKYAARKRLLFKILRYHP